MVLFTLNMHHVNPMKK